MDRGHHVDGRPKGDPLERQLAVGVVKLQVQALGLPHALVHATDELGKVLVDAVAALALALLLLDLVRVVLFFLLLLVGDLFLFAWSSDFF